MVNLDQAKKNVANAQNQLDQALKELEKAKKPGVVWDIECRSISQMYYVTKDGGAGYFFNPEPCKVTVRPLGGPGPCDFLFDEEMEAKPCERTCLCGGTGAFVTVRMPERLRNVKVRVRVEEI